MTETWKSFKIVKIDLRKTISEKEKLTSMPRAGFGGICGHRLDGWLPGTETRQRELADTGFVSVQNFVKLGLYLNKWYDKQQASWEVQILKFRNWICLRKLHRSGLDLLPFFQVLPSSAMVFTLIFRNSCSQNLRSFANILPKLDFTKFWRNTKCMCAETLRGEVWKCPKSAMQGTDSKTNLKIKMATGETIRELRVGELIR